jgi:hypothetical protein
VLSELLHQQSNIISNKERGHRIVKLNITKTSFYKDILLTLLTFGIWNIYVQMRQIWDVNELLKNREKMPSFVFVVICSLFTLGIYFCYHEYKLTRKLHILLNNCENRPIEYGTAILAFFGLWFVVDSYQQDMINQYIDKYSLNQIEE